MRDLADDYYDFDQRNYCLVGRRYNNRYRLGDAVTVQVARCDLDRKQLDFVLVDEKNPPRKSEELRRQPTPQNRNRPRKRKEKTGKAGGTNDKT